MTEHCFCIPSVMSTCVLMHSTHMPVGFGEMAVAHMQHKTCPGCARGFIDGLPFVPNMSMRRIYIYIYMRVCYAYPRDKRKALAAAVSKFARAQRRPKKVESRLSSERIIKIRDVVAFFVRAVKKKRTPQRSLFSLSFERA